jgi:hypothetical protein
MFLPGLPEPGEAQSGWAPWGRSFKPVMLMSDTAAVQLKKVQQQKLKKI